MDLHDYEDVAENYPVRQDIRRKENPIRSSMHYLRLSRSSAAAISTMAQSF